MTISYATEGTLSYGTEGTFRLGDAFSKSFAVYGKHFAAFVVLTVFANIPNYMFGWGFAAPGWSFSLAPHWSFSSEGGSLLAVPVAIVCGTIATGAMTYGVVQDLRGAPVSIGKAVTIAARRFLPLIGVGLSVGILSFLAFIVFVLGGALLAPAGLVLIIPGIIVVAIIMCMYFVVAPVCVAERAGVRASLSRSRFLTGGYRWQIFGAYILIAIFGAISSGIAAGATSAVGGIAATIVGFGVQAIFGAFGAVLAAVLYYQLRVAKEGVDLAKIASVFE